MRRGQSKEFSAGSLQELRGSSSYNQDDSFYVCGRLGRIDCQEGRSAAF